MGQFDWLGSIPPPQVKESNKTLSTPASEKQTEPTYEDRGVAYKGYAKKRVAENQWITIPQYTRFYSIKITNVSSGSHTTSRSESDKKVFYCTLIILEWKLSSGVYSANFKISDVTGTAASTRYNGYWFSNGEVRQIIDLSSCPREFKGDSFDLYTQMSIAAGDHFHVQLFGFDEDKS